MKKKHLFAIALAIGITLICLSLVLTVIETANKNIIGGTDLPTFLFVFFSHKRGLYSSLAFLGAVLAVISVIVRLGRKNRKE